MDFMFAVYTYHMFIDAIVTLWGRPLMIWGDGLKKSLEKRPFSMKGNS